MVQKKKKITQLKKHGKKVIHQNRIQRGKQIASARKKQITRAAYEVIAKKGYYNFTMMDIANQAGVSTGLIHHYFGDKENMLVTLLREMQQNIRSGLEKSIEAIDNPKEKLEIFINQAFDLAENEKEYIYVIFDFMTQIKLNERMRRILSKLYRGYRETLTEILREGKEKNVFKDVNEHFVAALIISAIIGLEEQYVIDSTSFPYREYTNKIKSYIFNQVLVKK